MDTRFILYFILLTGLVLEKYFVINFENRFNVEWKGSKPLHATICRGKERNVCGCVFEGVFTHLDYPAVLIELRCWHYHLAGLPLGFINLTGTHIRQRRNSYLGAKCNLPFEKSFSFTCHILNSKPAK